MESDKPIKAKNSWGPPGPPQKVELADWGVDHMDLTWAKPMNNGGAPITKYTVYRRCETTKQDWEEVATTDQNTYKLDDKKGLVYKHKYQYRVCAHNKAGEGAPGGPTPLTACRKRKCKCAFTKFYYNSVENVSKRVFNFWHGILGKYILMKQNLKLI